MSKVKSNYEIISDKAKNPVTDTEYIKHGTEWLDTTISNIKSDAESKAGKTYVDTELAKKADASTVSALANTVNSKANASTVSSISERVSEVEREQNVLDARMDTFTNLEEGSTTGDAELIDGRVSADGITYANIGDAIRGQVSDLKSDLRKYNCVNVFSEIFAEQRENEPTYYDSDRKRTTNGITFQWGTKWGQCNISGTATKAAIANVYYNESSLPSCIDRGKTYPFKVKVNGDSAYFQIRYMDETGKYLTTPAYDITKDSVITEITVPDNAYGLSMRVRVNTGATASNESIGNFEVLTTLTNKSLTSAVDNCFSGMRNTVNDTNVYKSFNDFEDDRFYCINTTGLTECPENTKGILLTFGSVGGESTAKSGRRLQIFRSSDTNMTYIRSAKFVSSAGWSEWSALSKDINPSVSLFKRIGVIGDSFASGEVYTSGSAVDNYEMSWLQIMARQCGFIGTNYSKGGLTSQTWLTDTKGLSLLQSSISDDLYLVALGINDANRMTLGTAADIGTDAETFYGCYSRIVNAIKAKNSNSKIICFTTARFGGNYDDFSNAIKTIATSLSVQSVDVSKHSFFTSSWFASNQQSNHPTVSNYSAMSNAYRDLIEECIADNPEYFKNYSSNNCSVHTATVIGFTKEVYVDASTGNDGNDGTSEKPFATLERALNLYNGYYDEGQYNQFVIYLSNGTYVFPYRSTWHGCPHIFAMSGKNPVVKFTINDNAGPRFYSSHVYFKGITFESDFNGFYCEGSAVTAENCVFKCAFKVIGGSFNLSHCKFQANESPYTNKACVNLYSTNGRLNACEFEHTGDIYAVLAEVSTNLMIVGGITCTNTGESTKPAIKIDYSALKSNGSMNFTGYTDNKIALNASVCILTRSAYDSLNSVINNTNSLVSAGAIDLVELSNSISTQEVNNE